MSKLRLVVSEKISCERFVKPSPQTQMSNLSSSPHQVLLTKLSTLKILLVKIILIKK